jgi:NADPH-dependent glutamate synthase beta subunit-like oxidoreductase
MKALLILAALMIFVICIGCAPKTTNMPMGKDMPPPIGAVQYCHDHQEDELCHE